MFFRPCRDSLRFLPLFPSDESLGYYLSPSGLGWSDGEEFLPDFRFLHNIRVSGSVCNRSAAVGGDGRNDSRGQGLCGVDMTSAAPLFVHGRAAMSSAQRHRDRRKNPQFIAGDDLAPRAVKLRIADCRLRIEYGVPAGPAGLRPPASGPSGGRLCETKPICGSRKARANALWIKGYDESEAPEASAKQSQFSSSARGALQGTARTTPHAALQTQGRARQTKPMRESGWDPKVDCAKQTQSAPSARQ